MNPIPLMVSTFFAGVAVSFAIVSVLLGIYGLDEPTPEQQSCTNLDNHVCICAPVTSPVTPETDEEAMKTGVIMERT